MSESNIAAPSRPRDSDRKTRIHISFYDRAKFLLFFAIVFFVLVWADMAGEDGFSR
jgi:cell division protease FtsH